MYPKNESLTKLREAKGMTQENIAHKSNVSVRTVQRAEAGTRVLQGRSSVFAIAVRVRSPVS